MLVLVVVVLVVPAGTSGTSGGSVSLPSWWSVVPDGRLVEFFVTQPGSA